MIQQRSPNGLLVEDRCFEDLIMWQWHNNVVRNELQRHIELASPNKVGIVATETAKQMYAETLAQLAPQLRMLDPAAINLQGVGVISVIAENNATAWSSYSMVMGVVGARVPVVYCLPDRRIARSAPGWENTGIHYEGMFKLASLYVPTVTRSRAAYAEFGVYDGKSFILACHALKDICSSFFAFDSFGGIKGTQADELTHFADAQYSASRRTLEYNLRFAGVDLETVKIVPGYFQESIVGKTPTDFGIEDLSIVHIDTDVYEPALLALEFVTPALRQGSLLLFDDYDQLACDNSKGERRAVHEWLAKNPNLTLEPYRQYATFSRAFVLHKRPK